jgi:hypothetical protein
MPTNSTEFFTFKSGEKVAFIGNSAAGSISVIAVD